MLPIQSVIKNKGKRRVVNRCAMLRFGKKILKCIFACVICAMLYFHCKGPVLEDRPKAPSLDSLPDLDTPTAIDLIKHESTLPPVSRKKSTTKRVVVRAQFIKVGYFDLKGNDLACDKDGRCHEFRVRNSKQAITLCGTYGKDCQGFVFESKSGRLFLKNNLTAEIVHDPFLEFYVRAELRANVDTLEEVQCAIPVDEFQHSSQFKCNLPTLDPFNANVMKYLHKTETVIVCQGEHYTAYHDGILSLLRTDFTSVHVKAIRRKPGKDWGYDLVSMKHFNSSRKLSSKINEEFLQIKTVLPSGKNIVEYHAEVVPKVEVLQRKRRGKGLNVNILLVGFDSTSSAQMQRALPKVYKFLKDDLNSYLFNGYSVVGDGTTPQLTAMLTGQTEQHLPEARRGYPNSTTVDSWPWIFREFRERGYATLYSEDDEYYNAFNYRLFGFRDPPADHYPRPFWQAAPSDSYCIKSTPQPQLHFNYVKSFMKAYKNHPKIGLSFLAEISHSNMNTLRPTERYVLEFFKSMREKEYLNDTILITFSDHGMRFGEARVTTQSRLEERLPFLSITLPERIRKTFPQLHEKLNANTNRLLSPFDIHATLRHILHYPKSRPAGIGRSLFRAIPEDRSCAMCGIPEHYCPCVQLQKIPITHLHVRKAAEGLVVHINKILKGDKFAAKKCSTLRLGEVRSAYQNLNDPKVVKFMGSEDIDGRIPRFRNHTSDYECNYQLLVETLPGSALFEVTVQLLDGKFLYGNEISRINKYGDQPNCIAKKRPYLRKFCFCTDMKN